MTWTETKAGDYVGRVRVSVTSNGTDKFLNVRKYYEADDGTLKPTKQGVMIPREQWEEFKGLVNEMVG